VNTELGLRPIRRARCIAWGGVDQQRLDRQHFEHLLGVGLPVGGAVQRAALHKAAREQRDQRRLDQAALVVPLLRPGVGEEDMDARQRRRRDHPGQHFDRVVLDDAHIAEALLADASQQRTDAGRMYLDADEVAVGHRRGDLGRGLPHAESDLEHDGCAAAEDGRVG
jgi:hypothetical protein